MPAINLVGSIGGNVKKEKTEKTEKTECQIIFRWGVIVLMITEVFIFGFVLFSNIDPEGNVVINPWGSLGKAFLTMIISAMVFTIAWLMRGLERRNIAALNVEKMEVSEHQTWIIVHNRYITQKGGLTLLDIEESLEKLKKVQK